MIGIGARKRSIGEKDLVREKDPMKEEPAKELLPRKESYFVKILEERLYIKGRVHVNCFSNCLEELFSYFLRKKKEESRHLYLHAIISLN